MKALILLALVISTSALAQVQTRFACKLNAGSMMYQMLQQNPNSATPTLIANMKSRCERKTDEASCSRNSDCLGVNLQIQLVPQVIGIQDSRSLVPLRELRDGSVSAR